jgi:DNA invertase Pin-like site-specific DNA recombinase
VISRLFVIPLGATPRGVRYRDPLQRSPQAGDLVPDGLEFLRDGDTLLVTKIDRLARSTSDLYRIVSELAEKGVSFRVLDDPSIDTTSRTGKLVMGILALIAEFENDIRRERQMDGIAKAKDRGVKFGRKRELTDEKVEEIRALRESGETVPAIIKHTGFSKASVYRALS